MFYLLFISLQPQPATLPPTVTGETESPANYTQQLCIISGLLVSPTELHPTHIESLRIGFFSSIRIPANHSHTLLCSYSRKIRHKKRILDGIIECL